MARPLRIEYEGAVYHVTSRGNDCDRIFFTDTDREAFLELLKDAIDRFSWICHGYCLMTNHYHLVVETPHANLSRGGMSRELLKLTSRRPRTFTLSILQ